MESTLIKLAYRQTINASSQQDFEKKVFYDTYAEYCLQAQSFDRERKYITWHELRTAFPKANINMPYKVGFAIGLYVQGLNQIIPEVKDSMGNLSLPFAEYRLEILASDITNRVHHQVALHYTTPMLTLLGIVGEYMVLSLNGQIEPDEPADTFMLKMIPGLSIISWLQKGAPVFLKNMHETPTL